MDSTESVPERRVKTMFRDYETGLPLWAAITMSVTVALTIIIFGTAVILLVEHVLEAHPTIMTYTEFTRSW